jgi:hypothetical protein
VNILRGTYAAKSYSVLESVPVRRVNGDIADTLRPADTGGKAIGA